MWNADCRKLPTNAAALSPVGFAGEACTGAGAGDDVIAASFTTGADTAAVCTVCAAAVGFASAGCVRFTGLAAVACTGAGVGDSVGVGVGAGFTTGTEAAAVCTGCTAAGGFVSAGCTGLTDVAIAALAEI